jgi:DNA-binding transcriptional ArsR family regulator
MQLSAILAEPRRQQILRVIADREVSAGEIGRAVGNITLGALSQHLRLLRESGVVDLRKEGRFRFYRISPAARESVREYLGAVWALHLLELRTLAEAAEPGPRPGLPRNADGS